MAEGRVPVDPTFLDHWAMARWESGAMMYLLALAHQPVKPLRGTDDVVHVDAELPQSEWGRLVHHRARRLLEEVGGMIGPGFEIRAEPS